MITASVNDAPDAPFAIDFMPNGPVVNDQPLAWDLVRINDSTYHILLNNRSFTAELIDMDVTAKTVKMSINGHLYTVQLKDRFDLLLEQMGMSRSRNGQMIN